MPPLPMPFPAFRPFLGWRLLAGVLLGLGLAGGVGAQQLVPHFSVRRWEQPDGLPAAGIGALGVDRAGYLWLATAPGLVRFDGTQFVTYPWPGRESRRSGARTALVADPVADGVWAAAPGGGLVRFQAGRYTAVNLPAEFAQNPVVSLMFAADGALWVGFADGAVLRRHAGRDEIFDSRHGLGPERVTHLAVDARGRVWLANGPRLVRYEAGTLRPLSLGDHREDLRIATAREDGPWVLTRGWLHKVVGDRLSLVMKINASLNAHSVLSMQEDAGGSLWVGLRARGLRRLTMHNLDFQQAVTSPEDIGALAVDAAGDLWAGGNDGGLVRVKPGVLRRFGREDGLRESRVLGICEDAAGTVWVANRDGGVAFLDQNLRFVTRESPRVRDTFSALTVAPAPASGVWVGSSHGLLQADRSGWVAGVRPQPPDYHELRVAWTARNGDLWLVLGPGRIGRLREGGWSLFDETDALEPVALQAIAEDAAGRIWVGGAGGVLHCYEDGRWRRVPSGLPAAAGDIQAIHFDAAGQGWLGTSGAGLARLGGNPGGMLHRRQGLPTNNVTQIVSDGTGLWCGSPDGIFHVRQDELEAFFLGRLAAVSATLLGPDEGLEGAVCAPQGQPAAWRTRAGLLWFATRGGAVVIDPQRAQPVARPLAVRLGEARADGQPVAGSGPLRLAAGLRSVDLDFSVICLSAPERVRARLRLAGYEEEWTPVDERRSVRYSRLPPGEYRFQVEASLVGVPGSEVRAERRLVVAAAWWQTWWFRAVGLLGLGGAGVLAVRAWSHRRLRAQLARLEQSSALERERARIAQNLHDDLGAGLTRISLLTQTGREGEERAQLDRIYATANAITRSMDEIVWAVNPKNDDLEGLANYLVAYAQGFLTDAGLRCRVELPDFLPARPLSAQARHHLFLACKEALHNVVKHARASAVTVRVEVRSDVLEIVIADDGGGAADGRAGAGNGLANMAARLAELKGRCDVAFSATGTTVTLAAPLAPVSSPS